MKGRRSGPARLWCVDKPEGPTSFAMVRRARAASGYRRVGHAGTLDPFASGLLVLGLGGATRLLPHLGAAEKVYRARVRWGTETDSADRTGEVVRRAAVDVDRETLERALAGFVGEIEQVPPALSAVHVDGRRAYARARAGEEFEIASRRVTVHGLEVLELGEEHLDLRVRCGGGTYVRSLARDLGRALGGAAHLEALVRERIGPFSLDDAAPGADLAEAFADGVGFSEPARAFDDWPTLRLGDETVLRVRHGTQPEPAWWAGVLDAAPDRLALLDAEGRLVALALTGERGLRLAVVLMED